MGPKTVRMKASEVRRGDRIASRNRAGGFVEWLRVGTTLTSYGVIECDRGDMVVSGPTEEVEIEMRRIDAGDGRVWVRAPQLDREIGRWIEMPARYDEFSVTEDDLAHDCAIRRLTDAEVERAEEALR